MVKHSAKVACRHCFVHSPGETHVEKSGGPDTSAKQADPPQARRTFETGLLTLYLVTLGLAYRGSPVASRLPSIIFGGFSCVMPGEIDVVLPNEGS